MPLLTFEVLLLFEPVQRWELFNLNIGGGFYLRWELTFKVGPGTPLHTMRSLKVALSRAMKMSHEQNVVQVVQNFERLFLRATISTFKVSLFPNSIILR